MKIAIVGGGINGLCSAWLLAKAGHQISLFERKKVMQETSRSSSKMLHGGLRYLEYGEFKLVYEALHERKFWVKTVPHLAHKMKLYLPVYENSSRSSWKIRLGLFLYDILAGRSALGKHKKEKLSDFLIRHPDFKASKLKALYSYYDAQMLDEELGLWVAEEVKKEGGRIYDRCTVERVSVEGELYFRDGEEDKKEQFDRILNIAGPWADALLQKSAVKSNYHLDLVRGSHIFFEDDCKDAFILESIIDQRVFFVLPYKGKTLVGTTEVQQSIKEAIIPSEDEIDYLLESYNHYFKTQMRKSDIVDSFAGLRPLVKTTDDVNATSREYEIEENGKLITVFGGKWTTARSLAKQLVALLKE